MPVRDYPYYIVSLYGVPSYRKWRISPVAQMRKISLWRALFLEQLLSLEYVYLVGICIYIIEI